MSEVMTRLEYGQQLAAEAVAHGATLAQTPAVVFDQRTRGLGEQLHISTDKIIDFAVDKVKIDPAHLQSMAVCLYDRERDQSGWSPIYGCQTTGEPRAFGDNPELHFPLLALGVKFEKSGEVDVRAANNELTHQIWHLGESQRQSWLKHPAIVNTFRALGGLAGIASTGSAIYLTAKGEMGPVEGPLAIGSGSVMSLTARAAVANEYMEFLGMREMRANFFSIRNYGFTPITRV